MNQQAVHFNTDKWIKENKRFFLPPVCNKMMHWCTKCHISKYNHNEWIFGKTLDPLWPPTPLNLGNCAALFSTKEATGWWAKIIIKIYDQTWSDILKYDSIFSNRTKFMTTLAIQNTRNLHWNILDRKSPLPPTPFWVFLEIHQKNIFLYHFHAVKALSKGGPNFTI